MPFPRLYVIGDSISMQYGPYLERMTAGRFAYGRKRGECEAALDLDSPQGDNGGDSSKVLRFLSALHGRGGLPADIVLLNCGLHDIKTDPETGRIQIPLPVYAKNLVGILDLLREMVSQAVWIRTTPCDERVHNRPGLPFHRFARDCDAYNAAADAIMARHGIPSIDLHAFTLSLGPELYCDHVHFHERIRESQAAYMAGWLEGWMSARRIEGRLNPGPHDREEKAGRGRPA